MKRQASDARGCRPGLGDDLDLWLARHRDHQAGSAQQPEPALGHESQ
jgi:hypothetical protein